MYYYNNHLYLQKYLNIVAAEQALRSMEGMDRTMVTIERFDAQIESLEGKMAMTESSEEEEKLRSRVVMIEAARDAAFEKLQKFK